MLGIHDPLSTLRLMLLPLLVHGYGIGLVVCEQQHVRPLLHQRGGLGRGFLPQLHFPPVIGPQFVRLLELPHLRVGGQDHMDPFFHHVIQEVQEAPELFPDIHISVSISEIFNPLFLVACTDVLHAQLFRPVDGIDHQRPADFRMADDITDLFFQHGPGGRRRGTRHIQLLCAPFRINEQRFREPGSKCGFSYSFRAINHDFLCSRDLPSDDFH